jgi:hypothetical protein
MTAIECSTHRILLFLNVTMPLALLVVEEEVTAAPAPVLRSFNAR